MHAAVPARQGSSRCADGIALWPAVHTCVLHPVTHEHARAHVCVYAQNVCCVLCLMYAVCCVPCVRYAVSHVPCRAVPLHCRWWRCDRMRSLQWDTQRGGQAPAWQTRWGQTTQVSRAVCPYDVCLYVCMHVCLFIRPCICLHAVFGDARCSQGLRCTACGLAMAVLGVIACIQCDRLGQRCKSMSSQYRSMASFPTSYWA